MNWRIRVQWVECLLTQQLGLDVQQVRCLAWRNFAAIVRQTGMHRLLPEALAANVVALGDAE